MQITGESPDLDKFVDYVLGELGSLQEYSGGNSGDPSKTDVLLQGQGVLHATAEEGTDGDTSEEVLKHMVSGVEVMVAASEDATSTSTSVATKNEVQHEDDSTIGEDSASGNITQLTRESNVIEHVVVSYPTIIYQNVL